MVVSYRECLRNHAASLGGHALDGCGEFIPSSASSLACDACGCHRSFHRRDSHKPYRNASVSPRESLSPSPSPISASPAPYSYYAAAAAPHVLMALSAAGISGPMEESGRRMEQYRRFGSDPTAVGSRRRTRTRFSQDQKARMREFAERIGWRINGCDEKMVRQFCGEVGVDRTVLKVWMHNNKHSYGKSEKCGGGGGGNGLIGIIKSCKNEENGELHGSGSS